MSAQPRIIIIAGPNGAGKTTFAREFLPREADCPAFVNADLIAAGLSPFRPEVAAVRAGRLMLREIAVKAAGGESFAFETTLSGHAYARKIPQWRTAGYWVEIFFLSLPSVELAIDRVRARVAQGGHDVPEPVIRRRFGSGLANFTRVYQPLVDGWKLYDNAGVRPVLLEWGEKV
jgi:predicted ABC-type ATPase